VHLVHRARGRRNSDHTQVAAITREKNTTGPLISDTAPPVAPGNPRRIARVIHAMAKVVYLLMTVVGATAGAAAALLGAWAWQRHRRRLGRPARPTRNRACRRGPLRRS
jgi:uncharacterized protein (TIGR03382 family)